MSVVDTSAWVELLFGTDSTVRDAVDRLLDDDLATCDAISMELPAGACDEKRLPQLGELLARTTVPPTPPPDCELAAVLYRACRSRGVTVPRLINCLIGAVAVRAQAEILHADADFDVLGRHTDVRTHPRLASVTPAQRVTTGELAEHHGGRGPPSADAGRAARLGPIADDSAHPEELAVCHRLESPIGARPAEATAMLGISPTSADGQAQRMGPPPCGSGGGWVVVPLTQLAALMDGERSRLSGRTRREAE